MENLCEDVIFNILIFLPAEFLQESASLVCRSWLAIIRSPSFCQKHYSRHASSNPKLIVQPFDLSVGLLDLERGKLVRCSWSLPKGIVLGTSGGVLLVSYPVWDCSYGDRKRTRRFFYAINPLTRQHADLPPLPVDVDEHVDLMFSFASIAYMPGTGEYKVVCPYGDRFNLRIVFFLVLTLGTNMSWRRIDPSPTIFPNGTIHCNNLMGGSVSAGGIIYFYDQIFAVDLRNENILRVGLLPSLPVLRLPRDPKITESLDSAGNDFTHYKYFGIGKHLGRIEYGREGSFEIFNVAILKGFGSNNCHWSEKEKTIFYGNSRIQVFFEAGGDFAWPENSKTMIFGSDLTGHIATYNVKSKEFKFIENFKSDFPPSLFVHTNPLC